MKTTFQKIKDKNPCGDGWKTLINYHNPASLDEEVTIKEILKSNGIEDAVWALRAVEDKNTIMLFSADIAESVLHIFEAEKPNDDRVRKCIEATRMYARGEISNNELKEAREAARAARNAAKSSKDATWAAVWTAVYATVYAAWDTAWTAVNAAVSAANAARNAAKASKWKEIEQLLIKRL